MSQRRSLKAVTTWCVQQRSPNSVGPWDKTSLGDMEDLSTFKTLARLIQILHRNPFGSIWDDKQSRHRRKNQHILCLLLHDGVFAI